MLKRIFVGGLTDQVTEEQVSERFRSFGTVCAVEIIQRDQFVLSTHKKAFAYVTLDCEENAWPKLQSTFNNTQWKGMRLRLEEAKPDYKERLATSLVVLRLPKKHYYFENAPDMSLVTDKSFVHKRGWRHGKLGRAIAIMRLRTDSGKLVVVDPSHSKNSIERLFGSGKPLPVTKLHWFYESFDGKIVDDIIAENGHDSDSKNDSEDSISHGQYNARVKQRRPETFLQLSFSEDIKK